MNIVRAAAAFVVALVFVGNSSVSAAVPHAPPPDVLVVGGTPGGVAAAVAAARLGTNVELVAQRSELGGILTDAMMDQWDLNLARDGDPVQGGIFTELYARLGDSFTPQHAAAVFADLVAAEPRIDVVCGAVPQAVQTQPGSGGRDVTTVTFRSRDGETFTVTAPYVVDATDDGDVAALAGARYDLGRQDTGRDERMQPVTLIFTLTGIDWNRIESGYNQVRDSAGGATMRRAWGYADLLRGYRPAAPSVVVDDLNLGREDGGSVTVNAIDVLGTDGRDATSLGRARALTEREAPRLVAWLRGRLPGFERAAIGRYADSLYVRETRHFAGLERLTADDVWSGDIPDDTIGLSSYPLDLHPLTVGERPAFAPIRHVYGVPFGTLVPVGFANLNLASPAISASHVASGSARVIPTTIEEGEAAGAAAALVIRAGIRFPELARDHSRIASLRATLAPSGVLLEPGSARDIAAAKRPAISAMWSSSSAAAG